MRSFPLLILALCVALIVAPFASAQCGTTSVVGSNFVASNVVNPFAVGAGYNAGFVNNAAVGVPYGVGGFGTNVVVPFRTGLGFNRFGFVPTNAAFLNRGVFVGAPGVAVNVGGGFGLRRNFVNVGVGGFGPSVSVINNRGLFGRRSSAVFIR